MPIGRIIIVAGGIADGKRVKALRLRSLNQPVAIYRRIAAGIG